MKHFAVLAALPAAYALAYALPAELQALAATDNDAAAACYYPANYTVTGFTTFTPAATAAANTSSLAFAFADAGTGIDTACAYNASSVSLTAGTSLAARYACDNDVVSFIWQQGKLTLLEVICPGQTTTVYEASGSLVPSGATCANATVTSTDRATNATTATAGTLCSIAAALTADFTSDEPSPLQSAAATRRVRVRRAL